MQDKTCLVYKLFVFDKKSFYMIIDFIFQNIE